MEAEDPSEKLVPIAKLQGILTQMKILFLTIADVSYHHINYRF